MPEAVHRKFVQVGKHYHFPDGARAFSDHGTRLSSPSENIEVIKSLVTVAQARGWSSIPVSGTQRFKQAAWLAAHVAGLRVRGYSPTALEQARVARTLARMQKHATQHGSAATETRDTGTVAKTTEVAREESQARPRGRPRALLVGDSWITVQPRICTIQITPRPTSYVSKRRVASVSCGA
jgi:putative DNA primase/helicase